MCNAVEINSLFGALGFAVPCPRSAKEQQVSYLPCACCLCDSSVSAVSGSTIENKILHCSHVHLRYPAVHAIIDSSCGSQTLFRMSVGYRPQSGDTETSPCFRHPCPLSRSHVFAGPLCQLHVVAPIALSPSVRKINMPPYTRQWSCNCRLWLTFERAGDKWRRSLRKS